MNRLNPLYLFRGHWKTLSDYSGAHPRPARLTRFLLLLVPLGTGAWTFLGSGQLADPGAVLAGLSLFAGALLAAFGQLASWRLRLTEREENYHHGEQVDRDHLDETAAQLLVASYVSALAALALVLGMNLGADEHTGAVQGIWAGIAVALGVYVVMVFLIAVPRLYSAYVNVNVVRKELSGFHREHR